MILHKLAFRFLKYKDDIGFTLLQAEDAVRWLEMIGIELSADTRVLDLGCGRGLLGGELMKKGCRVTFADEFNCLLPEYNETDFHLVNIDKDDLGALGLYDLVICSNVLEHIPRSERLINAADRLLRPGGKLYLSWTNWLSPWGGHDYSPFHYLGPRCGHLVFDRIVGKHRTHTPHVSLFPTSIGGTLKLIKRNRKLIVLRVVPRYYPSLAFITRIPFAREFLTWNCVILLEKRAHAGGIVSQ